MPSGTPTVTHPADKRPRGRPPQSEAQQQAVRDRILDATRAVFTRVGYHGLSVELVIAEAGISRPTFYKYFRNTDEPIEIVLTDVNDRLIERLLAATDIPGSPVEIVEAGLAVWRVWGDDLGPMLRPLYSELHDVHSPASRLRRRTLDILAERLGVVVTGLGRPLPSRLLIDALLNGVEFLGYRYHLETPRDDASWKATRDAMLRLTMGLLGNESEWQMAVPLAHALHINLNTHEQLPE